MPRMVDMFNHYLPPEFYDRILALGGSAHMLTRARNMQAMSDLQYRLEKMAEFEGYQQVPCIVSPNVEQVVAPEHTAELARFANECFYTLTQKYPDQFPTFVATLPLDDMEKAAREAEYAITQLGAAGAQIFTIGQAARWTTRSATSSMTPSTRWTPCSGFIPSAPIGSRTIGARQRKSMSCGGR